MANAKQKKANPGAPPAKQGKPEAAPPEASAASAAAAIPMGGGLKVLIMLAGAVIGALAGLGLGTNLIVEWHGTPFDLRAVAVVAGAVLGFWSALLLVRKR